VASLLSQDCIMLSSEPLRTLIFGRTPWTFTICTPLLTGHDAGVGMIWGAGHPRSSPSAAAVVIVVIVGLNREDVSGQSTDQTMRHCVMLLCALDCWTALSHAGTLQAASTDPTCDNYRLVNAV